MKRVVAIGDLHVGSLVALAGPEADRPGDSFRGIRRRLFAAWREAIKHAGRPDVLVVNGDLVEGQNRKGGGIGVWSCDLLEQADHCCELLRMWRAKRIVVVRGSPYHVEAGHSGVQVEEYIGRRLNAVENDGQASAWEWYLDVEGVCFHVSHRIAVSRVFHYQSTPTARQLLQARLNDRLRHLVNSCGRKIQIVLRGHAHYYNTVGYSGCDGFVLPCWKAYDDYLLKTGPLDISPDIGYVEFECDKGSYRYRKGLWKIGVIHPPKVVSV